MSNLDIAYMECAKAHASLSKGIRGKVGAVIVTPSGVLLGGCNGLASGGDNSLEYKLEDGTLKTKPEVIHAELNCVLKAAEQGVSIKDSTIYTTLSPCLICAEMLVQLRIKRVVYLESYRCLRGVERLFVGGVQVDKIER